MASLLSFNVTAAPVVSSPLPCLVPTAKEQLFWDKMWKRGAEKFVPILHQHVVSKNDKTHPVPAQGVPCHLIEDDPCTIFHERQNPRSPDLPIVFTQAGILALSTELLSYTSAVARVREATKGKHVKDVFAKFFPEVAVTKKRASKVQLSRANEAFYRELLPIVQPSVIGIARVIYSNEVDRKDFLREYARHFCEFNERRHNLSSHLFYTGPIPASGKFIKPAMASTASKGDLHSIQMNKCSIEIKATPICYLEGPIDAVLYRSILGIDNVPFSRFVGYLTAKILEGDLQGDEVQLYFTMYPLVGSDYFRIYVLTTEMDRRIQINYVNNVIDGSHRAFFTKYATATSSQQAAPKLFYKFIKKNEKGMVSRLIDNASMLLRSRRYFKAVEKASSTVSSRRKLEKIKEAMAVMASESSSVMEEDDIETTPPNNTNNSMAQSIQVLLPFQTPMTRNTPRPMPNTPQFALVPIELLTGQRSLQVPLTPVRPVIVKGKRKLPLAAPSKASEQKEQVVHMEITAEAEDEEEEEEEEEEKTRDSAPKGKAEIAYAEDDDDELLKNLDDEAFALSLSQTVRTIDPDVW
jgi:hypothetical protein